MTTRKRRRRTSSKKITPYLIKAWTRLKELEAMDLPDDDPRRMAHGEMAMLSFEVNQALDIKPWDTVCTGILDDLDEAAGRPYATELERVEEAKMERAQTEAEEHATKGPMPWGVTREQRLDEFEENWGYRPEMGA